MIDDDSCIVAAILRMIYVSTVDIRGDLTSTMPITVFLAAFEPNLAVLCASIPMLRPCYTRYRQRRESKRSANSSSDYSSGMKDSSSSKTKKQRNEDVELDTVFMLEHDAQYRAAVDARSHHDDTHTLDGSERNLAPNDETADPAITVHKTWKVSHR